MNTETGKTENQPLDWSTKIESLSAPLPIEAIDFRVQSINKGGYATILAYKDARVDMDRLDTVLGRGFWKRRHDMIDGQLFCTVEIWNPMLGEWVGVQDVGTESKTEAEKGRASDSFKRACFNLGIGRELYAFPQISVKLKPDEFKIIDQGTQKERAVATWNLKLKDWKWYMERNQFGVTFLAAQDDHKNTRFTWGDRQTKKTGE